jgi:type III pantothenate kinase
MLSFDALASCTSQLPHVSPSAPPNVIGKDTETCMESALVFGTASMLDGLIERIETELGESVSVVATGDWIDSIIPHCRRIDIIIDNELIMRGLWSIYMKNRP